MRRTKERKNFASPFFDIYDMLEARRLPLD